MQILYCYEHIDSKGYLSFPILFESRWGRHFLVYSVVSATMNVGMIQKLNFATLPGFSNISNTLGSYLRIGRRSKVYKDRDDGWPGNVASPHM